MTKDEEQARVLRDAACILLLRAKKQTFLLRTVVCILELSARRIEKPRPVPGAADS